ncbi:MAG: hypothetical protein ACOZNI_03110 [Myxococcota bacterium]
MGIRSRLRGLLRRQGPSRAGQGFGPAQREAWEELVEQVDAEIKKAGSSVVGAWEVGAAELGRVMVGDPDDKAVVERFSDALVPTLQPFQDLHKGVNAAMRAGLDRGLAAGRLDAATAPLLALVEGLGGRAATGWRKTVAHLEPVIARAKDPAATRARLDAGAAGLAEACEAAERVLRARVAALADAPTLWDGVTGAVEDWQLALTRELEIQLCGLAKGLVRDLAD